MSRAGAASWQAAKTHCPNRHEYTPDNTLITADGYRRCRTCNREKEARNRRRPGVAQPPPRYQLSPQTREWREHAACVGIDPEMFQPKTEEQAFDARMVCLTTCPVLAECAIEAESMGTGTVGVWAGKWYPEQKRPGWEE